MSFDEFEKNQNPPLTSKGNRFLNYVIDTIVIVILFFIIIGILVGLVIGTTTDGSEPNPGLLILIGVFYIFGALFIQLGYYTLMEHKFGKTLGKMASTTKVINQKGEKPTLSEAFIRSLCRLIPFEWISILIDEKGEMWHDKFSKTRTVEDQK